MRMTSRCAVTNSGGGLFISILENEVCGVGGNVNTKEEGTMENKTSMIHHTHYVLSHIQFAICKEGKSGATYDSLTTSHPLSPPPFLLPLKARTKVQGKITMIHNLPLWYSRWL
jgi:hypothetical protein